MSVAFFSMRAALERDLEQLGALVDEAFDAGRFVDGPLVRRLEAELEQYTGAGSVIAVGSGSDALIIALRALGIGPGDEVVVPVYTFFATASSVVHAGATPVFADVDPETYAIDPNDVERRITGRTRAIMPVHPFLRLADVDRLAEIAELRGLVLFEDSAQGIGMRRGGRHAGCFGAAGILSFFPTKTLGALGDAGAIVTDDADLADRCRRLRGHGQVPGATPYTWDVLGHNSRMDDLQAAVLLTRLRSLDSEIERRAQLARAYDEALEPLAEWVRPPSWNGVEDAVVYVYLIQADHRDELVEHLTARGIETEVYYPRPLHLQPCFAHLGHGRGDFPVAERAADRAVALPLYPDLTEAQVEEVCAAIAEFYGAAAGPGRRETVREAAR
ncbi:MAG TPA: DegT/DnrJ/EryC1/StrS family aminotransferase [Solirubrobacteraceae bacterium]|jgi:dTDP-4-amino-4,6-dideoxygalactose transaminase|nr:DegT/DnrJ/EryC1/StrS family aminotransferase [Solirubrobacteraceae bacterium]